MGDYVGNAHVVLLQNINKMPRSEAYSNSVLLIQSSGTGKSRLVDEQGKLVFTIPFNIRPQIESKGQIIEYYISWHLICNPEGAYPAPDVAINHHLVSRCPKDFDRARSHYLKFLRHLFQLVQQQLQDHIPKVPTYQDLASTWREHLETDDNRESLYDSAVLPNESPEFDVRLFLSERLFYNVL